MKRWSVSHVRLAGLCLAWLLLLPVLVATGCGEAPVVTGTAPNTTLSTAPVATVFSEDSTTGRLVVPVSASDDRTSGSAPLPPVPARPTSTFTWRSPGRSRTIPCL